MVLSYKENIAYGVQMVLSYKENIAYGVQGEQVVLSY